MKKLTFLGVLALCLCTQAQPLPTTYIYVNQNVPASSALNGTSWSNAFQDLQMAISNAHPTAVTGVEIRVASGVYYPTQGTNQSGQFLLTPQ